MQQKVLLWVGSSLEDLRAWPPAARRRAGHELHLLQTGLAPTDFKSMPSVGSGVYELRIRAGGAFRILYLPGFDEGIYVLHAFQKRSRRTSRPDVTLAAKRYREVIAGRRT